jgi:A/G-specific adenine glycosylase
VNDFGRRLLAWYDAAHRSLPWRDSGDPYRIWVSEIMLQQTRVESVVPYFHKFMARFPTVAALARAPLDDVLALWSGLGYYARARHMHRAAGVIVAERDGAFPDSVDELRRLPGIGEYTAAAIASIAFGRPVAAVDGNVKRVVARRLGIRVPLNTPRTLERIREATQGWLPRRRAGDFNQAMMELGATVCLPRRPNCANCPVRRGCTAFDAGTVATIPARTKKRAVPHLELAAAAIVSKHGVWVQQRPERGLLGGLWELPTWSADEWDRAARGLRKRTRLGAIEHAFSHRTIRCEVFRCEFSKGRKPATGKWMAERDVAAAALAVVDRKKLALLWPEQ